jgi:hypothetical protein
MTPANWVTLAGIIVAAAIALIISYMQRKQMRQIELHRTDPTVSLVPPLHPVTHFLKTYGSFLALGIYDLVMLMRQMHETTPVTRQVIFGISLDMAGIVLMITFGVAAFMVERALNVFGKTIDIIRDMNDMTRHIVGKMEKMAEQISQLGKGGN